MSTNVNEFATRLAEIGVINNDQVDRLIAATPGRSYIFYDDDVYMKNGHPDRIITDLVGNQEA